MILSPDQKHALLQGVDLSNAVQVFDAVAAALAQAAGSAPQPAAWARPDELDRLSEPGVNGRSCYLSRAQRERCTVPLYPAAPDNLGPARELVLAAVRHALARTREAASQLEDLQFRSGMEAACEEIEAALALSSAADGAPQDRMS
ncbi:hypothetical protein [Noviherbaspirillum autotrophicum]|uniref:Uncharacterized protein n=1 Tax=Noviherbaspirillum autotrophicum TaxID=709839 RepID=A0A0C1Y1U4_9BURK|nr:hypothetical protein [Noviherbaspirillum autotrophicum]KIF81013.1 hypothetical protein TSA66_09615 [Noviherbaspirillum autotrophicum]